MPTNQQVIQKFSKGEPCNGANLWSTGQRLYSYQTCIAQWETTGKKLIVNKTKYSRTTSGKHQSPLFNAIRDRKDIEIIEVKDCPWGVDFLENYINKKEKK